MPAAMTSLLTVVEKKTARKQRPGGLSITAAGVQVQPDRLSDSFASSLAVQRRAQIVVQDILADILALVSARLLVEPEVDAAIDPRIVDVVGDLSPLGVVEDHARQNG